MSLITLWFLPSFVHFIFHLHSKSSKKYEKKEKRKGMKDGISAYSELEYKLYRCIFFIRSRRQMAQQNLAVIMRHRLRLNKSFVVPNGVECIFVGEWCIISYLLLNIKRNQISSTKFRIYFFLAFEQTVGLMSNSTILFFKELL